MDRFEEHTSSELTLSTESMVSGQSESYPCPGIRTKPLSMSSVVRPAFALPGVEAVELRTLEDLVLTVAHAVHDLVALPPAEVIDRAENLEAVGCIHRMLEDVLATCTGIQLSTHSAEAPSLYM